MWGSVPDTSRVFSHNPPSNSANEPQDTHEQLGVIIPPDLTELCRGNEKMKAKALSMELGN